jgi:hypothetical protein
MKLPAWLGGRGRVEANAELIGCWERVKPSVDGESAVEMQFEENGRLRYCVLAGDSWQIMKLTYRIEGNTLVSNQPSVPREERTRFAFEDDGTLVLEYDGEKSKF